MLILGLGNFCIVTSAVAKAYPPTKIALSHFSFQAGTVFRDPKSTVAIPDETFWGGINVRLSHNLHINNAKGILSIYITLAAPGWNQADHTLTLTSQITKPGATVEGMKEFMAPLIEDLNDVVITLENPEPQHWSTHADFGTLPSGPSGGVMNNCLVSRLIS